MLSQVATSRQDGTLEVPVGSTAVVSLKDLVYVDTGVGYVASSQADQLTEDLNQKLLARRFVGVSEHAKTAAQTFIDKILVNASFDAIHEFNCVSEVHAVGDWIGGKEQGSGTALEAQKLVKVTDRSAAIFECVRKDTVASTTVQVRRLRQDLDGRKQPGVYSLAADLTLTKNSPRILAIDPNAARKVILAPEADSAGVVVHIANTADAGEDITVRDSADANTIVVISQNERGQVFCDGTAWYGHTGAQT